MSQDSVNSINSTNAASSTSSVSSTSISSNQPLTAATKQQLEALGIDTTGIKTEAQGQAALFSAQASSSSAQKPEHKGGGGMSEIKAQAQQLASEVGVSVSSTDKIDDILSKISDKISQLQAAAGNDETKLAQISQYQSQLQSISASMSSMQASHAQLSNSMSSMASYNKIYQNLS